MRDLRFRRARRDDVPAIVWLLADDPLGAGREALGEAAPPAAYWRAFDAIQRVARRRRSRAADGRQALGEPRG
jgi:hypothetical protein